MANAVNAGGFDAALANVKSVSKLAVAEDHQPPP